MSIKYINNTIKDQNNRKLNFPRTIHRKDMFCISINCRKQPFHKTY